MATAVDEFSELLSTEVYTDLTRLREASRHGIPDRFRCDVWKFLLGVSSPDKSEEVSHTKLLEQEYVEATKAMGNTERLKLARSDLKRFHQRGLGNAKLEHVLLAYVNTHAHVDYMQGTPFLLYPFTQVCTHESDIYVTFKALLGCIRTPLHQQVADFLLLFRTLQPELFNYFEEEELDPSGWAAPWIKFLLAKELPLPNLLQLWDAYFAREEHCYGFPLHIYVMLAILENSHEYLMELDDTDIRAFLQRLPPMGMEHIINEAVNLRTRVMAMKILP